MRCHFPAVLSRLGAKGYVGVELARFNGSTPRQVGRALDESGLIVSSAHIGVTVFPLG